MGLTKVAGISNNICPTEREWSYVVALTPRSLFTAVSGDASVLALSTAYCRCCVAMSERNGAVTLCCFCTCLLWFCDDLCSMLKFAPLVPSHRVTGIEQSIKREAKDVV